MAGKKRGILKELWPARSEEGRKNYDRQEAKTSEESMTAKGSMTSERAMTTEEAMLVEGRILDEGKQSFLVPNHTIIAPCQLKPFKNYKVFM